MKQKRKRVTLDLFITILLDPEATEVSHLEVELEVDEHRDCHQMGIHGHNHQSQRRCLNDDDDDDDVKMNDDENEVDRNLHCRSSCQEEVQEMDLIDQQETEQEMERQVGSRKLLKDQVGTQS